MHYACTAVPLVLVTTHTGVSLKLWNQFNKIIEKWLDKTATCINIHGYIGWHGKETMKKCIKVGW